MIQDPVAEWQELSALYEQAEALDAAELQTWINSLPLATRRLRPQLERMLAARVHAGNAHFLEVLPSVEFADVRALEWQSGSRINAYRLKRHIGSGGMAEVWLAERADESFERQVAIKLLHRHPARSQHDTFVERFRRERDILASLDHPNIAGLHDAGVSDSGQPWLALEYVKGEAITTWCDDRQLTIEARVRLFLQVLWAIEHAHARLVIHRDIKPSNVLVDENGSVRLLDFGIAKLLESDGQALIETELTRQAGRPLTPQYASPEQLLGDPLTTASDIYSLGVLLYEMLIGELPYALKGKSAAALEAEILDVDASAPSRRHALPSVLVARTTNARALRKALHPDLDAIVLSALAKRPAKRYDSAGAMRADLERWLGNEPVLATIPGPMYRVGKFIRRHRIGVAVGTSVIAILVFATSITWSQSIRAKREASRALVSKDFLLDMFRLSDPNQSKGADVPASQLLDASVERANRALLGQPELRAEVLRGIADIDHRLGRYRKSQEALTQVASIYEGIENRKELARTRVELAWNAFRMGDLHSANLFIEQSLEGTQEFSADQGFNARRDEVRGWLASASGDLQSAKSYMIASLTSARSAYGGKDNRTADALRGLAEVDAALGNYEEAKALLREARQSAAASTNAAAGDLVDIEIQQAALESKAGNFASALPLIAVATADCDAALGEQNEDCFYIRAEESLLLLKIGSFSEAKRLLPSLMSKAANDSSPERQADAAILSLRVLAANDMSRDQGTLREHLQRIASSEERLSDGGIRASAALALAEAALREGRYAVAGTELAELLAGSGPMSVAGAYRARALMLYGISLQLAAHHRESLEVLRSAESSYVASYGLGHTEVLLCRANQIPSLIALGHLAEASALINNVLPALRRRLPERAPVIARLERLEDDLSMPSVGTLRSAGHADFFN